MGIFDFGGSKASQSSKSDASSYDIASSQSSGRTTQSVFGGDLYSMLFGDASKAAAGVAANLPTFQGDAAMLFSGGTDFLKSLGGDAGTDYLTNRLGGDDAILNDQITGLSSDLDKFFKETLLPGITSEGVMSGQLGGGRDQIARGTAAGEVARQFTQGVTALRSANQAQKDAAAGTLTGAKTAAAGVGLSALPSLLGLSQSNVTAGLLPMEILSKIFGDRTTLTDSLDSSSSSSVGASAATARSKGKSGSFDFGFG